MGKNILWMACLVFWCLAISSCNTNGRGASNPNNTDQEFINPTGNLTTQNIQSVVEGGINGTKSFIFTTPESIFSETGLDFDNCATLSGDQTNIDWECVFDDIASCTASGETLTSDFDDQDFITIDYNDLFAKCGTTTDVTCDGQINVSKDDDSIFCSNLFKTVDDSDQSFNGCINANGEYLVRIDGDSFVILSLEINADCTILTTKVRDKNGTETSICDITSSEAVCANTTDIHTVDNCAIL